MNARQNHQVTDMITTRGYSSGVGQKVVAGRQRAVHTTRKLVISVLAALLIILGAGIVLATRRKPPDLNSVVTIQSRVSKHLVLPQNETPALITVTDTSKLTTPFLKQTQNGDKILVYQDAKKVIIYRPSVDRVIDVGPVSIAPIDTSSP